MHILIIGYSSIVIRRTLPALLRLPQIKVIDIASRRPIDHASLPDSWTGQTYIDYDQAITDSPADLVYVSLVNSLHEKWVETSLRAGKHVVVDKPAFLSLQSAERLLELAAKNGLCLAEAVVFGYHPQIEALQEVIAESGGVTRLAAVFSIPPLPQDNFRYDPELGGGSLYDQGPYAVAVSRIFFEDAPQRVMCQVVSRHPTTGVDTAFSVLATFSEGRSYTGHFGFDTEYQNQLTVIGPRLTATMDHIFTTPQDADGILSINRSNQHSEMATPKGDSFEHFFARVADSIENRSWTVLGTDLLKDARMLDQMRTAASDTG